MWCQDIHVLVSDIPFCGLLSTENVYSNLLSEINLFSSFLKEKYDNLWMQNALCSVFAKERFAAVSETTEDRKVREHGMFPVPKINFLKPFSPHPSTR